MEYVAMKDVIRRGEARVLAKLTAMPLGTWFPVLTGPQARWLMEAIAMQPVAIQTAVLNRADTYAMANPRWLPWQVEWAAFMDFEVARTEALSAGLARASRPAEIQAVFARIDGPVGRTLSEQDGQQTMPGI